MTRQVWKFELHPGENVIEMPAEAKLLTVQMQHGEPYLWALVYTDAPRTLREFNVVGTGHNLPEGVGLYVGTFQMEGGALVWHVFEKGPE